MKKTYRPLARTEKASQMFKKKTLNVNDDLNIKHDEDDIENVEDYWNTAVSVIGNSTIDSIDHSILTEVSDTLFNIKNIRKSIRNSINVKHEVDPCEAKIFNEQNTKIKENMEDKPSKIIPIFNIEEQANNEQAYNSLSFSYHETPNVEEPLSAKSIPPTKTQMEKEPQESIKKETIEISTIVSGTSQQKRLENKDLGHIKDTYTTNVNQEPSTENNLKGKKYKPTAEVPVDVFLNTKDLSATENEHVLQQAIQEDDLIKNESEQSVSTKENTSNTRSKKNKKGVQKKDKIIPQSSFPSDVSFNVSNSETDLVQKQQHNLSIEMPVLKTFTSAGSKPTPTSPTKKAKHITPKGRKHSFSIEQALGKSKTNVISPLVCSESINTALMTLDYLAYCNDYKTKNSFSVFVMKGKVKISVNGTLKVASKGEVTIIEKDDVFSLDCISVNGAKLFLSYSL